MDKVVVFINLLRGPTVDHLEGLERDDTSHHIMGEIFTQGNCGAFALALQVAFGGEVVAVDGGRHFVLLLDNKLYDINGDVSTKYSEWDTPVPCYLEDCTSNYSFAERGPIL